MKREHVKGLGRLSALKSDADDTVAAISPNGGPH